MNTLFKSLTIAAPIAALVFWWVVSSQNKIDNEINMQNAQFDREWAEMRNEFKGSNHLLLRDRAGEADKELKARKEEAAKREEKARKAEEELDRQLQELDRKTENKKENKK